MQEWLPYLQMHPDREFAEFMKRGLSSGFRIGFNPAHPLRTAPANFRSVQDHPATVDKYIAEEVASGRLVESQDPSTRRNPIGIISKPHQPGKFRLIVDLSAPQGFSVNDGISSELCSLVYISVDKAASLIACCGRGALMAKTDLRSAYRQVPVHTEDQTLLGLEWRGRTYRDRALPFGLRSAPKLFTAVADSLAWAFQCNGIVNCVHYLDDFLFWGPPASPQCGQDLQRAISLCTRLGLPVALDKTVGPSTVLTFLGFEIDSMSQEIRLPADKLCRLRQSLSQWERKRNASKHELQAIVGLLNHAAAVVRPGRTFIRQLIDASKRPRCSSHRVRLNASCRADIAWWATFISEWNGIALFPTLPTGPSIISDASGSWGCGAYTPQSFCWFQLQWPQEWVPVNIAVKELLPIVMGAALWGQSWEGSQVLFRSDNQAVVSALSTRSTRDPHMAHLLRCLFFFEAHFRFEHRAQHIAGKLNLAADALSRNRLSDYFCLCPQAPQSPTPVPSSLKELMMDKSLNWTSPRWRSLFENILREVSPVRH